MNPERAYGERLATRLAHQGVADIIPLGDGLSLTELIVPASFVGRSLIELTLPKRHGVTVVAIRMKDREGATHLLLPDPRRPLREDDVLLLVSPDRRGALPRRPELTDASTHRASPGDWRALGRSGAHHLGGREPPGAYGPGGRRRDARERRLDRGG
ncbi:MAG: hypothetical protein IPO67_18080 [Deltaproteobacteria bacterium]|nr:hypothetical protein [Deltaproteobacteria bacterium]